MSLGRHEVSPEDARDVGDHLSTVSEVPSDESESWDGGASSVQAEESSQQLAQVREVLSEIFDYYSVQSAAALKEPWLTSSRFSRMAMDAVLVGGKLTAAKIDVAFAKVCKGSPHMNLDQFRDAIVGLAAIKFPTLKRSEAVVKLYQEHLAMFAGTVNATCFDQLTPAFLSVLARARPSLQTLYEGYFGGEIRLQQQQVAGVKASATKRASVSQTETQGAFAQVLIDFEVVPELAPKATAYAVCRDVAKVRDMPADIREAVTGGDPSALLGVNFTYCHFAVALALMGQRCFSDDGPGAVVRFFEWMDASKGRLAFISSFPGLVASGGTQFRIYPEALNDNRRSSHAAALDELSSVSTSSIGSSAAGSRRSVRRSGAGASSGMIAAATGSLSDGARQSVQDIFRYYAGLADPLNRSNLSSLKFGRFLRDCGLLSVGVPVSTSPQNFDFAPDGRRRNSSGGFQTLGGSSSSRSSSAGGLRRSGSAGSLQRRGSTSSTSSAGAPRRASFTVSSGRTEGGGQVEGLPLQVFSKPPLAQADADLIFVQAVRAQSSTANSGSNSKRPSIGAAGRGPAPTKHMTVDGFSLALADIARRCMPPECVGLEETFEDFSQKVLAPLNEALTGGDRVDVHVDAACALSVEPEAQKLLQKAQPGLDKIFNNYAVEGKQRRKRWLSDTFARFCNDFEISKEVSHIPLQKIFQACTTYETSQVDGVDGEISIVGFSLALLMVSQKIHSESARNSLDRVVVLFNRINVVAGSPTFGARFGPPTDSLLAVPRASATPRRSSSASALQRRSVDRGRNDQRQSRAKEDLSWAEMMAS